VPAAAEIYHRHASREVLAGGDMAGYSFSKSTTSMPDRSCCCDGRLLRKVPKKCRAGICLLLKYPIIISFRSQQRSPPNFCSTHRQGRRQRAEGAFGPRFRRWHRPSVLRSGCQARHTMPAGAPSAADPTLMHQSYCTCRQHGAKGKASQHSPPRTDSGLQEKIQCEDNVPVTSSSPSGDPGQGQAACKGLQGDHSPAEHNTLSRPRRLPLHESRSLYCPPLLTGSESLYARWSTALGAPSISTAPK
jgi:hypothetical protein